MTALKKPKWRSVKASGLYDRAAYKKLAKVRITTHLDHDVLKELKREASRTKKPYQTILNDLLRLIILGDT